MTKATVLKQYNHFKRLVDDKAFRESFCMSVEKDGLKLNSVKSDLIKSDAQKALDELIKKFPDLVKVEVKEEVKTETKSKGKK